MGSSVFGDNPLSPLARALLDAERGRSEDEALKSQALERARLALDTERPSGIALRRAGLVLPSERPRSLRTLWLVAAAVTLAGIAAAASLGAMTWRANEAPPPVPAARTRGTSAVPELPPKPAAVSASASAEPAPEPRAPQISNDSVRTPGPQSYADELALLEPARSGISHGDYAAALSVLARHRREFPNGQLVEEREALRVRALWGLGQKSAARSAAKAFRKRYPRSALLSWLSEQDDGER